MQTLKPETKDIQSQLAAYCRVPVYEKSIAGTRPDRLPNYRRLVFNIIEDTLQNAFPITHTLLSGEEWMKMVNDFFEGHNPQPPQLWRMPFGLVEFFEETDYHHKVLKRPYLLEMIYFEWLELEIYQEEDKPHKTVKTKGNLLNDKLVVNPDHKLLPLSYPVHKKNFSHLEASKGNYFVHIYRHKENFTVNFVEFSPFLAIVFSAMLEHDTTLKQAVEMVALANNLPVTDDLLSKVRVWADQLLDDGAILGFEA